MRKISKTTKSRHFSVISERQIIRSYIRLANHHEKTQKKYTKEKPSERKVQLRLSQKHVWNDFENIIKSHFSVISERQIIRSYIRLANHHEETHKKERQGKAIREEGSTTYITKNTLERFRKHNKTTTFLSNFRKSNHRIKHTLSKPSRRDSKKVRQGKAIREEGSTTYITKNTWERFRKHNKITFLSNFSKSNDQIIETLSKPARSDSKKVRQGKAREEGSPTFITKTREKDFENNKITTFLSNFRTSNHQIIHTLSKASRKDSKKVHQGKAIREEGSTTYITKNT